MNPPSPADTFTLLIDTSDDGGGVGAQLWLPSGETLVLRSPLRRGEWAMVVLRFDWEEMRIRASINGEPLTDHHMTTPHASFGPHPRAFENSASVLEELADLSPSEQSDFLAWLPPAALSALASHGPTCRDIHLGFQHLYLFTWLENPAADDVPAMSIGDIWLEGEQSPSTRTPSQASLDLVRASTSVFAVLEDAPPHAAMPMQVD